MTVPPELVGERDPYTLEQVAQTATLNAAPETATNRTDTAHTITATYANRAAQPQPIDTRTTGERVVFKIVQGPNRLTATNAAVGFDPPLTDVPAGVFGACDTGANGTCQQSYTGANIGRDVIVVFVDKDGDLVLDADEPADVVDKTWVGADDVGESSRLGGQDRIDTAVKISQALYNNGAAQAVVLARADKYPDALTGAPLAHAKKAPLLLTFPPELHGQAATEIRRVLGNDTNKTIYMLGGDEAITPAAQAQVAALGYQTVRIFGAERVATAAAIATQIEKTTGPLEKLLITSAFRWPDAVVAGAAAAHLDNTAVLLSGYTSTDKHEVTEAFINAHLNTGRYAIGGPAVNGYALQPEVYRSIFGVGRVGTSAAVAEFFYEAPVNAGLARAGGTGTDQDPMFADALTGGVHIGGRQAGPMLLTGTGELSAEAARNLCWTAHTLERAWVYGGERAIAKTVQTRAEQAIRGGGAEQACSFDPEPAHGAFPTPPPRAS
ncbi:MAG: cell wall-binding repeat-containing protein [Actinobacteria bacterium]|nr:cell wall-binding repeat-containing protein [Actinomycetota bacterium]